MKSRRGVQDLTEYVPLVGAERSASPALDHDQFIQLAQNVRLERLWSWIVAGTIGTAVLVLMAGCASVNIPACDNVVDSRGIPAVSNTPCIKTVAKEPHGPTFKAVCVADKENKLRCQEMRP